MKLPRSATTSVKGKRPAARSPKPVLDKVPLTDRKVAEKRSSPAIGVPGKTPGLLQEIVLDHIADGEIHRATRAIIDALPAIHSSHTNMQEKLNTLLFLSRAVQNAGGAKHGTAKMAAKVRSIRRYTEGIDIPEGGYLELGCGAHDPVTVATYFYLNGMMPAWAIDTQSPRSKLFSALSMYDVLAHIKLFPERYLWRENKASDLLKRLESIDVAAFEQGNFDSGLASFGKRVRLVNARFEDAAVEAESIALLTSHAVLEHVDEIDGVFDHCFAVMVPGGIAFHFIDLVDHRSYRGDGKVGPFGFLTEVNAPANFNRLRAPEIAAAALRAGFEVVTDRRTSSKLTDEVRAALVEPFSKMPEADVAVIKQQLVLRKPASG